MIELERLGADDRLLQIVRYGQMRAADIGLIPFVSDLSLCSVVASDDRSALVVFTKPGKHSSITEKREAYIWWWWRENRGSRDGLMDKLVERALEIVRDAGAEVVMAGISSSNTASLKLASRTGLNPSVVYVRRDLAPVADGAEAA